MSKIYQELLEIKSLLKDTGQKIDSVSNSNVANNVENQIQTQINNYSKKTFKSLVNYNKEIKIKKQYTTKQERKAIFWLLLIAAFIFPVLVIYFKGDKFVPDPFANCIYTYILFFSTRKEKHSSFGYTGASEERSRKIMDAEAPDR